MMKNLREKIDAVNELTRILEKSLKEINISETMKTEELNGQTRETLKKKYVEREAKK